MFIKPTQFISLGYEYFDSFEREKHAKNFRKALIDEDGFEYSKIKIVKTRDELGLRFDVWGLTSGDIRDEVDSNVSVDETIENMVCAEVHRLRERTRPAPLSPLPPPHVRNRPNPFEEVQYFDGHYREDTNDVC